MYKLVKNTAETKIVKVNGKDVEIPVDWISSKISTIFRVQGGSTPDTKNPIFWDNGNIPWISPQSMTYDKKYIACGERFISIEAKKKMINKIIPKNSLIISTRAPIGYLQISQNDLFTNQGCHSLINDNFDIINFIYYNQKHNIRTLEKNASGTTFKELSKQNLLNIEYIHPLKLSEQEEIADFLSHIENTIFKTEELIASMEKRLRYYIRELTSGRLRIQKDEEQINLVENEHFKTVQVNGKDMEIPVDWDVKKINELCNFINGSAFNNKTWTDSGYKIVRIQNLNGSNEYNHYDGDVSDHVIINNNDIIFSWSGTIDIYRWKLIGDYVLNQHIFKVTNTDKLALDYVYYALQSILLKIKKLSHGSTMKHITKQNLYSIDVIYPPNLFEQEDIGNLLLKEEEDIEKMKKILEMQKKRFKWAMSALLSGRYTLEKVE